VNSALPNYQALAELRYQIRNFLHFSEQAARARKLEPQQHQLLLAIKGLPGSMKPRIAELAERMKLQHHSTVELANRLMAGGYLERHRNEEDHREVWLALTAKGERVLRELSFDHQQELDRRGPELVRALQKVMRRKAPGARSSKAVSA
jgi:DNA-binding MarR family transcriptional regulator